MPAIAKLIHFACFALAVMFAQAGNAGATECEDAIQRYNMATNEVSTALRVYATCITGSRGRDDCSSEFDLLRSAQDDFELAVERIRKECGQ